MLTLTPSWGSQGLCVTGTRTGFLGFILPGLLGCLTQGVHSLLDTRFLFALRTCLGSPPGLLPCSSFLSLPLLVRPPLNLEMSVSLGGGLISACIHSPSDLLRFAALNNHGESPLLLSAWPWSLNSRRPRLAVGCLREASSLGAASAQLLETPLPCNRRSPILLLGAQVQSLGVLFSLFSPRHPSANPFPNLVGCALAPEAKSDGFLSFPSWQSRPLHSSPVPPWVVASPCSQPGLSAASVPF